MSDNKRYYWLKLKENFFDSEEIIMLESMQDGFMYSNLLIKMYLKSVKYEGRLMFNNRIPYNPQMIATLTRHQVGTVEKALRIFEDLGLIEVLDNQAIYMLDIQNFIGESSTEADRKRSYRKRIEDEKTKLGHSSDNAGTFAGQSAGHLSQKRGTLLGTNIHQSIELDIEKDIEKDKTSTSHFLSLDPISAMYVSVYEKLWQRPHREINNDVDWPLFIHDLDDDDFREMAKQHIMANIQHPDRCFIEYFATVADRYR